MCLWYSKDTGMCLTAYVNADQAGCQDTRRSTSESVQFLGDKLVSWSFKKQKSTKEEIELETRQTSTTTKLPILKQENRNSFKPTAQITTNVDGSSTLLIPVPVTTEETAQNKNDVKARSMLLMALPNEHLLTFNQYKDAKTLFAAIQTRFGGNEATKKTQKTLLNAYGFKTSNTHVSSASTQVSTANLSDATVYAFLANQPNGSQLVHKDLVQIHKDDLEEMDLKWQLAFLSMRTKRKGVGFESYNVILPPSIGLFSLPKLDLSNSGIKEFQQPEFEGYRPKTSESVSKDTSNKVKESPDALLVKKAKAVNTARPKAVNTARPSPTVVNVVRVNQTTCLISVTSRNLIEDMLLLEEEQMVAELLMCDRKNNVLFTDTKCLVLFANFKLPDESQILLRVPRKHNMYRVDMKNIFPKEILTCLVAKATLDESMLWHRRLGHINFKNINKLVKDNLVRGSPLKHFKNDQTCFAYLKGKQHKAFCKSKIQNSISQPLFMLHMDLFGPTFVSSLMHKKYGLVVIDDYSRYTWVFFLETKDETTGILKKFITEIENLVDKKVKVIRCDNGTEFKNSVMNDFCAMKGLESKVTRECCFVVEIDAWIRGELTLSSLDVLQGLSFFFQMGFTLIMATLDGLDVGLLGYVIGENDCDDDG
uniref:Putative ribonuclease H-like domain-containing protein n=1 Tax=Tanacetum cinerariifolium TaxID=118510 RepID=A0A6L2KIH4_TANCI|nr:putative ribonuclease H-like domain-containing protein [Tanacetum cinerariifolium]